MSSLPSLLSGGSSASPALIRNSGRPPASIRSLPDQCRAAPGQERGPIPREVATRIVARLEVADLCEPPEIAGPGFINFRLRTEVLAEAVTEQLTDPRAGMSSTGHPQTVVIDYSGPNVAKQMHVGHLRSTIIGDCLYRVLVGVGHRVIAENHIGDWGTQFGMLVEQILDEGIDPTALTLPAAEALYARGSAHFRGDPEFADQARRRVVALQSGDEQTRTIWQQLINVAGRLQRGVRTARRAAHRR